MKQMLLMEDYRQSDSIKKTTVTPSNLHSPTSEFVLSQENNNRYVLKNTSPVSQL